MLRFNATMMKTRIFISFYIIDKFSNQPILGIILNGVHFKFESSVKNLGAILYQKLKLIEQVTAVRKKANPLMYTICIVLE